MQRTSRSRLFFLVMTVLGGVTLGSGALFFIVLRAAVQLSVRDSLLLALIGTVPILLVTVPAMLIGLRRSPQDLPREPSFVLLLEFVRAAPRFVSVSVLALVAYASLAGGRPTLGVLAAIAALALGSATLRSLRRRVDEGGSPEQRAPGRPAP